MNNRVIRFPEFEQGVKWLPGYQKGMSLFERNYKVEVHQFPNKVWVVTFPKDAPLSMRDLKICIQIHDSRVVSMSCTCYQRRDCEHAICGLFHIREKWIDEDYLSAEEEEIEEEEDVASQDDDSQNSFIDDRDYAEEPPDNNLSDEDKPTKDQTRLENEFTCPICLEALTIPVVFSCLSHNVCYACAEELFNKEEHVYLDGMKRIKCPYCREKYFTIKNIEDLKLRINTGLKRIIYSYQHDKQIWKEKEQQLNEKIVKYEKRLQRRNIKEEDISHKIVNKADEHDEEPKFKRLQKARINLAEIENRNENSAKPNDNSVENSQMKENFMTSAATADNSKLGIKDDTADSSQYEAAATIKKKRKLNKFIDE